MAARRTGFQVGKHITGSTSGVNQPRKISGVDFSSQSIDVHVDQVRKWIEVLVPNMLSYVCTTNDPSLLPRQVLEQSILFGGQRQFLSRSGSAVSPCIENKIGNLDDHWAQV